MATRQDIEAWMDATRESRRMIELFGEDVPVDLDLGSAEQGVDQGKSLSTTSFTSAKTKSSSGSDPKLTQNQFLRDYPALMDPMNFLQLIARYPTRDIIAWAHMEHPESDVIQKHISDLKIRVLALMGPYIPGGEVALRQCLSIAKLHHRTAIRRGKWDKKDPIFIHKDIAEWYKCVSETTTSDSVLLPLSYHAIATSRGVMKFTFGDSDQLLLSTILHKLLQDPLFPYLKLQEIPDHILLDVCARYSYAHVLDMLKVNNSQPKLTDNEIRAQVESLIHAPTLRVPVNYKLGNDTENVTIENNVDGIVEPGLDASRKPLEYCSPCIDKGLMGCMTVSGTAPNSGGTPSERQPGQECLCCQTLKQPCVERSTEQGRAISLSGNFPKDYHRRQKICGHMNERRAEYRSKLAKREERELRAELYALLHVCSIPARVSLCLPRRNSSEAKLPSLIKSLSGTYNLAEAKPVNLTETQAQTLGRKVGTVKRVEDNNKDQYEGFGTVKCVEDNDEDEDVDLDALEALVMTCCERLEDPK